MFTQDVARELRIGIFVILGPPQAEPGIHLHTPLHGIIHQDQKRFIRDILSRGVQDDELTTDIHAHISRIPLNIVVGLHN
ncbi:MAG: hypothetical protein WCD66_11145 [Rhodanobacteraceae bacterium]